MGRRFMRFQDASFTVSIPDLERHGKITLEGFTEPSSQPRIILRFELEELSLTLALSREEAENLATWLNELLTKLKGG